MVIKWRWVMGLLFIFYAASSAAIVQDTGAKAQSRPSKKDTLPYYFYQPYAYGSQSKYNPGDFFINGGFGVWQFAGSQNVFTLPYKDGAYNTWHSLRHPIQAIKEFGVEEWFFSEIFPKSLEMKHGQFMPNYFLHMLGAGMQSRKLEEWYRYQGMPYPRIWSLVTVLSEHFFEEMVEKGRSRYLSVDPVTDFYIFNPAGILLFLNEGVCRFFSEKLILNEWSLQSSIDVRSGRLENSGQFYTAKFYFGETATWGLASYFGMQELFGITKKIDKENSISFLGGAIINNLTDARVSESQKSYTAALRWSAGVFYDRNNSALISLSMSGAVNNRLRLNVYPGLFKIGPLSPGVFIQNTGTWATGISLRYCPVGVAVRMPSD